MRKSIPSGNGWVALFFATTAFTGFIPGKLTGRPGKGGGTMGALVALALQSAMLWWGTPASIVVALIMASFVVGLMTIQTAELFMLERFGAGPRHTGDTVVYDRNETNIDEVHGQLIAGLPLWIIQPHDPATAFAMLVVCFFLFRLFDSFKWWPVKNVEERFEHTSFGIMADDSVAGMVPALMVLTASFVLHHPA